MNLIAGVSDSGSLFSTFGCFRSYEELDQILTGNIITIDSYDDSPPKALVNGTEEANITTGGDDAGPPEVIINGKKPPKEHATEAAHAQHVFLFSLSTPKQKTGGPKKARL